jgi:hypothetical protein
MEPQAVIVLWDIHIEYHLPPSSGPLIVTR